MDPTTSPIPKEFFWRRMHSLMGLWLVIFLIEHLLTNSQAALMFGEDGGGFVKAVNNIKSLPYLQAIEILLLAIPFAIHIIWGIQYLLTAEPNSFRSDGKTPSLPQYPRNRAYTWQRITSWILLVAVLAHVVQMRFLQYPSEAQVDNHKYYMVKVSEDSGLYPLAKRLDFEIYDHSKIESLAAPAKPSNKNVEGNLKTQGDQLILRQKANQEENFILALKKRPISDNEVIAVTKNFGTAELLLVRDTFKSPLMIALYTIFVLAAVFHAFNGLWTFMITWGVTLTEYSQMLMRKVAVFLMVVVGLMGLFAIWGTYWINLKG